MKRILHILPVLVILTFFWQDALGQKRMQSDSDSTIISTGEISVKGPFIDFEFVEEEPAYYYNKRKAKQIIAYRESQDLEKWDKALTEYVSNFRIANFYRDNPSL